MSNCNKISFPEGPKSFFPNNAWSLVQNASLSQHDDIRVHALHLQKQDDIMGKSNEIYPSTSSFTSPNAHLTASKCCGWSFEWCGWTWETFGLPRSLYSPIFIAGVFPLINSAIQGSCSIPGSTSRVSFWLYKEHPVSSFDTVFRCHTQQLRVSSWVRDADKVQFAKATHGGVPWVVVIAGLSW